MLRPPKYLRLLDGITMEMYGGETVAIMYANEREAKALIGLLTSNNRYRGTAEGAFSLNGLFLSFFQLNHFYRRYAHGFSLTRRARRLRLR